LLCRTGDRFIELEETRKGLRFWFWVPNNDPGERLAGALAGGGCRGCSFAFLPTDAERRWLARDECELREVRSLEDLCFTLGARRPCYKRTRDMVWYPREGVATVSAPLPEPAAARAAVRGASGRIQVLGVPPAGTKAALEFRRQLLLDSWNGGPDPRSRSVLAEMIGEHSQRARRAGWPELEIRLSGVAALARG
jgi:hypothetical protein